VSQKTRHPIVTIISSNRFNRFSTFFHCYRKSGKFATKHYVTLPTTPTICFRTTSRICGIRIMPLQTSRQCL